MNDIPFSLDLHDPACLRVLDCYGDLIATFVDPQEAEWLVAASRGETPRLIEMENELAEARAERDDAEKENRRLRTACEELEAVLNDDDLTLCAETKLKELRGILEEVHV